MNQPGVSVFIITYLDTEERCRVLEDTCRSALQQRYPNFEVVVSDNAGKITAEEALASIDDSRLTIFRNEENLGMVGNMNACIERCEHEIIKMNCDDDLLHPDFLATVVPFVDDNTFVTTGVKKFRIGQEPDALSETVPAGLDIQERPAGYGRDMWNLPYSSSGIPSATIFTRKLFESIGGYDANIITADWDFFMEACLHFRIVHINHPLCFIGVWPGSLTEEMMDTPYFFPREGLYTKFRVLRCKPLATDDRKALLGMLRKEYWCQLLRMCKNFRKSAYRVGLREYSKQYKILMNQDVGAFGSRPNRVQPGN